MQQWLFDSMCDVFSLFIDCQIQILSVGSEFVENDDGVISVEMGLLLQLLNTSDDFSSVSADFKLFVLSDVQKDAE